MLRYKINVLEELKKRGYTIYKIQKERILGNADITNIKRGIICSKKNLDKLCKLLECQPGDLIEYIPDGEE